MARPEQKRVLYFLCIKSARDPKHGWHSDGERECGDQKHGCGLDCADLYRAAKRTTTVANGKLQQINASREKGLWTVKKRSRLNSTAACRATRAKEPARTPAESRTGCAASTSPTPKTAMPEAAEPISSKLLVTAEET